MAKTTDKGKKQIKDFNTKKDYETAIVKLIRDKYSKNEECAILRKKLAGTDNGEFDTFNAFVEECKRKVKGI